MKRKFRQGSMHSLFRQHKDPLWPCTILAATILCCFQWKWHTVIHLTEGAGQTNIQILYDYVWCNGYVWEGSKETNKQKNASHWIVMSQCDLCMRFFLSHILNAAKEGKSGESNWTKYVRTYSPSPLPIRPNFQSAVECVHVCGVCACVCILLLYHWFIDFWIIFFHFLHEKSKVGLEQKLGQSGSHKYMAFVPFIFSGLGVVVMGWSEGGGGKGVLKQEKEKKNPHEMLGSIKKRDFRKCINIRDQHQLYIISCHSHWWETSTSNNHDGWKLMQTKGEGALKEQKNGGLKNNQNRLSVKN